MQRLAALSLEVPYAFLGEEAVGECHFPHLPERFAYRYLQLACHVVCDLQNSRDGEAVIGDVLQHISNFAQHQSFPRIMQAAVALDKDFAASLNRCLTACPNPSQLYKAAAALDRIIQVAPCTAANLVCYSVARPLIQATGLHLELLSAHIEGRSTSGSRGSNRGNGIGYGSGGSGRRPDGLASQPPQDMTPYKAAAIFAFVDQLLTVGSGLRRWSDSRQTQNSSRDSESIVTGFQLIAEDFLCGGGCQAIHLALRLFGCISEPSEGVESSSGGSDNGSSSGSDGRGSNNRAGVGEGSSSSGSGSGDRCAAGSGASSPSGRGRFGTNQLLPQGGNNNVPGHSRMVCTQRPLLRGSMFGSAFGSRACGQASLAKPQLWQNTATRPIGKFPATSAAWQRRRTALLGSRSGAAAATSISSMTAGPMSRGGGNPVSVSSEASVRVTTAALRLLQTIVLLADDYDICVKQHMARCGILSHPLRALSNRQLPEAVRDASAVLMHQCAYFLDAWQPASFEALLHGWLLPSLASKVRKFFEPL